VTLSKEVDSPDSDAHLERIFIELGNQKRIGMLFRLSKGRTKLSALSKELNTPLPEVHRNMSRLQNMQLVSRDAEGMFSLTPFGSAIIRQLPTFTFMSMHAEYFLLHSFGNLPERFIQNIGALEKTRLVNGVANVMEVFREIIESAQRYIHAIISQATADLTDLVLQMVAEKDVKLKFVMPEGGVVPRRMAEIKEKYQFNKLLATKSIERKMVPRVNVQIIMNERQVVVSFPDCRGEEEFGRIFYGEDENARSWCLEYFDHVWRNSDMFNEEKLKRST
jgi:predicted transcriptional regulator